MNEYTDWLVNSQQGDRAVVPCVSYKLCRQLLDQTAMAMTEVVTVNFNTLTVALPGRGSIDFVGPTTGLLRGRIWQHAFSLVGDASNWETNSKARFLEVLASRTRKRKEATQ